MWVWILFLTLIVIFLALDLGVFHKEEKVIKSKEAGIWTAVWVSIALAFSGVIYWLFANGMVENPTNLTPNNAVLKYITGYLIELSLSIDNVFVIAVIFSSFKIPPIYQHRVLFWGILGAIVFRGLTILFSFVFRQVKKVYPISSTMYGNQFFIKKMGVTAATPLFVALIIIELTDILFALDSIPAILAITSNPFIVFSSNILAILGLRSMYFLVSRMLEKFRFINYSLVVILAFVGLKMLFSHQIELPEWLSLVVISVALLVGILASLLIKEKKAIEE